MGQCIYIPKKLAFRKKCVCIPNVFAAPWQTVYVENGWNRKPSDIDLQNDQAHHRHRLNVVISSAESGWHCWWCNLRFIVVVIIIVMSDPGFVNDCCGWVWVLILMTLLTVLLISIWIKMIFLVIIIITTFRSSSLVCKEYYLNLQFQITLNSPVYIFYT